MKPSWKIIANDKNITDLIADRFISLRITDGIGDVSDSIELKLDDNDNKIELPNRDVQLSVELGYNGNLQKMGVFSGLEVELEVAPDLILIRASAVNLRDGVKTKKTRSFADITLGELVETIAQELGYDALVGEFISSIEFSWVCQENETDWQFLERIVKDYDGFVKIAGGKLIVAMRDDNESLATKELLSAVELIKADVIHCRVKHSERQRYDSVSAKWYDKKKAKMSVVLIGDGELTTELKKTYENEKLARIAARTALKISQRKGLKVNLRMAGRSELTTMGKLKLKGFREGIDGSYTVTRVEHELSNRGYRCAVEAEGW